MYRTMKARYIIAALLLMVAGLQTAKAQKIILYYGGKEPIEVNVARLDSITFVEPSITDGHEWVDLGLPSGTLWARTNIGADTAEDYGDYFAWGETETKENYSWDTYAYMQGGWTGRLTKYCTLEDEGTVDNLTVLEAADDAAMTLWSHNWQMPSKAQFEELLDESNTRAEWTTTSSGINGLLVTSKRNGESIFLPAASGYYGWFVDYIGTTGLYWSRMLRTDYPEDAYCLLFDNSGQINTESSASRLQGLSIRPVRYKKVVHVKSMSVEPSFVLLVIGDTQQLIATVYPPNADNPKVTWRSMDESVATVSSDGLVTAVGSGFCYILCETTDGSDIHYAIEVYVDDGHKWVDLGLPSGTLWAEMNVGADSPGGSGDFFAWGETSPNGYFNEAYYKYYYDGGSYPQKYNGVDNLTELEAEDDAAIVNWSTNWQTPSIQQLQELFDEEYVTAEWTWQDGSYGYLITSKANGNSIFLPKAGYMTWDNINHCPQNLGEGYYWSRNLSKTDCSKARYLYFNGNNLNTIDKDYGRFFGLPVRPVLNIHSDYTWPVESITLNETEFSLIHDHWSDAWRTKQLTATVRPVYALNRDVVWKSSDENIATVSSEGLVMAVGAGECVITCRATDGSGVADSCLVAVKSDLKSVDLGLPSGTLWATFNVGANYPYEAGDYFAWGETEPKTDYSWSTYKYRDEYGLTKYLITSRLPGRVDNKTELLPEDDAATFNWGSDWQMPSFARLGELIDEAYTTTEWTTQNGVYGRKITSKSNGNSIFLPAAGCWDLSSLEDVGSGGYYWSRSLNAYTSSGLAFYLAFNHHYNHIYYDSFERFRGQSVRPVRKQETPYTYSVQSIKLDFVEYTLREDDEFYLTATVIPAYATNKDVIWESSNEDIATVEDGFVRPARRRIGKCTITCRATDGSGVYAECQVTVIDDDHAFVDLGLPSGTLWATTNVGTDSPEGYGDYFAWGETEAKTDYHLETYKYYDGNKYTKYTDADGKTELDDEDDAATLNWHKYSWTGAFGKYWQMPSEEQIVELCNAQYTTHEGFEVNGVSGTRVTSKINGNSIFLPHAGSYSSNTLLFDGRQCFYWSRTFATGYSYPTNDFAWGFNSSSFWIEDSNRYIGKPVRPVVKK